MIDNIICKNEYVPSSSYCAYFLTWSVLTLINGLYLCGSKSFLCEDLSSHSNVEMASRNAPTTALYLLTDVVTYKQDQRAYFNMNTFYGAWHQRYVEEKQGLKYTEPGISL